MSWFLYAVILAAGYGLGRYRPLHRASDWANWQKYDSRLRRHSTRWWAAVVVLSTENIAWLIAHPVQGWHAWQHRNDPPPPPSPAVRIRTAEEAMEARKARKSSKETGA